MREEFKDRYGPLPQPVENLLATQYLRILAGAQGIQEIKFNRNGLDFFFAGGQEPLPPIIQGLMATGPKGLQFKAVNQFVMRVPIAREEALAMASAMLERLAELRDKE